MSGNQNNKHIVYMPGTGKKSLEDQYRLGIITYDEFIEKTTIKEAGEE